MKRYSMSIVKNYSDDDGYVSAESDIAGDWVEYADHLADRASLLATLRQAVEAMEQARVPFYGVLCGDFGHPDNWPGDRSGVVAYKKLMATIAACREKLEEKA